MPEKPIPDAESFPCMECGKSDFAAVQRMATHVTKNGRQIQFADELTRCIHCGEEFYTHEQSMAHSRALATAVREAEGLFSPERIREIRMRLSLSQENFERALGVGRKTVVRWERGTVPPSRAANGLIWFAERYPSAFLEFAQERLPKKGTSYCEMSRVIRTVIESSKMKDQPSTSMLIDKSEPSHVFTVVQTDQASVETLS